MPTSANIPELTNHDKQTGKTDSDSRRRYSGLNCSILMTKLVPLTGDRSSLPVANFGPDIFGLRPSTKHRRRASG